MDAERKNRFELLRKRMAEEGVDALLVSHLPNIFYLCGFSGSAGCLLVMSASALLLTDARYSLQARAEVTGARICIVRDGLATALAGILRAQEVRQLAFEGARLSVLQQRLFRRSTGSRTAWRPISGWVEDLRTRKSPREVARMRQASRLASSIVREVLPLLRPGVRENEIAAEIDYRMRRGGASGAAFETIVASGRRTALPHARPSGKRLRKNELVLLDLGAILRHYCSDLSRTIYLGRAPERVRAAHRAILEAQAAARDALRPGVSAESVDAAARQVLMRNGLGRYFVHSTGHGLGLEVHEEPRLAVGQKTRIQEGFVVTLEPGVYWEGVGGIRVEDDVVVTRRGHEVLTDAPRELIEL